MTPISIQPQPGVKRDGTRFDGNNYQDAQWCRWQRGKPRKMGGYRASSTGLANPSRGLDIFSRSGVNYVHSGSRSNLESISMDSLGNGSPPVDRTPAIFTPDANNVWQFDIVFDPIVNNDASIVAHAAPNLSSIDSATETPVFYGKATGTTALLPVSQPIQNTSFTVATTTGNTHTTTTVDGIASMTGIVIGQTVTGTGIPANTHVVSIVGSSITISNAATSTNTGITLTFAVGGVSGGVLVIHPYLVTFGSAGVINWSTNQNPNDFWGSGSGTAYITEQKIVAGRIARGGSGASPAALLWSLNSLLRMSYVGGSVIWQFDTLSDTISIMSPASIAEYDGIFYWIGVDRILSYNGVVREVQNDMNLNWFFDGLNASQRQKVFAVKNTRFGEIWWCYPRGTATECTHAIVYNVREGTWYDTQLPGTGRTAGFSPEVFQYPLMSSVSADSVSGKYVLWQHEYGVDEVNGANTFPILSYFVTCDTSFMALPEKSMNKAVACLMIEPDFVQDGDMTVQIIGNFNARAPDVYSEIKTFPDTPTSNIDQVVRFKEVRRQMRFKFSSNTVGGNYQMGKITAQVQPDHESITG